MRNIIVSTHVYGPPLGEDETLYPTHNIVTDLSKSIVTEEFDKYLSCVGYWGGTC